jgi:hypothetical protein
MLAAGGVARVHTLPTDAAQKQALQHGRTSRGALRRPSTEGRVALVFIRRDTRRGGRRYDPGPFLEIMPKFLLFPQGTHGVNQGGAARGRVGGKQRDQKQRNRNRG